MYVVPESVNRNYSSNEAAMLASAGYRNTYLLDPGWYSLSVGSLYIYYLVFDSQVYR